MYTVTAQINNGNPCPKTEDDAWDWETKNFETLSECISFLLDIEAFGYEIRDNSGKTIAEDIHIHCGISGSEFDD